ncbi:hypothetical protein LPTSP3_g26530 [Leptospira kobayashii]|uniref:Lipoprotein n=1 Tax=Leptospira kobayashii TaxID=1917830 RepID=A0ABM7ULB8_9LEPT|nr:hypothetical protein [Leptospira kobayashii]BDA79723.1 hypothetical protein LPTSP3_g26530 [Leptospira kobayashii]
MKNSLLKLVISLTIAGSTFVGCKEDKKDDDTAVLALLLLATQSGGGCNVTINSASGNIASIAASSTEQKLSGSASGSSKLGIVTVSGIAANKKVVFKNANSVSISAYQGTCPINLGSATSASSNFTTSTSGTTTSYTVSSLGSTNGNFVFFITATSSVFDAITVSITD